MAKGSHYSTAARHEAQQILAQPPFRAGTHSPAPFAGLLQAIGRGLDDAFGRPLAWLWSHTVGALHGSVGNWAWLVLAALALGAGGFAGLVLLRTRGAVAEEREVRISSAERSGVGALEHAAEDAEARGEHDVAVRLRFEAGLARLEARGIIGSRLTTTTDRMRARLASPVFDQLAERHEAIAYAHDAASKDDFESAGRGWSQVLKEAEAPPASPASPASSASSAPPASPASPTSQASPAVAAPADRRRR